MINSMLNHDVDLFQLVEALTNPEFYSKTRISNNGLKCVIPKPHNLYTIKDDNGKVIEWDMELVYTPFKKEDVKASVCDSILSVEIGSENIKKDPNLVYQGISNQYTKFAISLPENVDLEKISASLDEGMLKIKMPVKPEEKKVSRQIPLC